MRGCSGASCCSAGCGVLSRSAMVWYRWSRKMAWGLQTMPWAACGNNVCISYDAA